MMMEEGDKEIGEDIQFPFVLVGGEALIVTGAVLKHITLLRSAHAFGHLAYKEDADFKLEYGLWRLVLSYLAEYEKGVTTKNSWAQPIMNLELLRLYEMARILNYYDVPVVLDIVLQIIVSHLMHMPRIYIRAYHPKALLPVSETEMIHGAFEAINKQYALRREEALAVCRAYIKTSDIVELIDRTFLPRTTNIMHRHVCSSDDHSALLSTSRGLFAMGENTDGQLGTGIENTYWRFASHKIEDGQLRRLVEESEEVWSEARQAKPVWIPVPLPVMVEVISFECGQAHTILLTTDGLYGCGSNEFGQLGSSMNMKAEGVVTMSRTGNKYTKLDLFLPTPLDIQNVLLVACGSHHTMVYTRKGLYACGVNEEKQLGIEEAVNLDLVDTFMRVAFDKEVVAISCDAVYSLILSRSGDAYFVGTVPWETNVVHYLPHKLALHGTVVIVALATAPSHLLLLAKNGDVYRYDKTNVAPFRISGLPPITSITAIEFSSFFIDAAGIVYADGSHPFCKQNTTTTTPVKIPLSHRVLSITPGDAFTYFLTCDGFYVYEDEKFIKLEIPLTDMALCQHTIDIRQQQQRGMGCHQCGERNHALLGFHTETQRVFCNTRDCLTEYKQFRVL